MVGTLVTLSVGMCAVSLLVSTIVFAVVYVNERIADRGRRDQMRMLNASWDLGTWDPRA